MTGPTTSTTSSSRTGTSMSAGIHRPPRHTAAPEGGATPITDREPTGRGGGSQISGTTEQSLDLVLHVGASLLRADGAGCQIAHVLGDNLEQLRPLGELRQMMPMGNALRDRLEDLIFLLLAIPVEQLHVARLPAALDEV